ncbi:MAG: stalk domain-containing protein [Firmicutes bacterium]|nr:stalk domain-containing protein [Bacillota bacterium]
MRKTPHKFFILNILIAILALTSSGCNSAPPAEYTLPESYIIINADTFPDPIFRDFVAGIDIDKNQDSLLSAAEMLEILELDLSDKGITSLQGIEFFTALKYLDCSENLLIELDISCNFELGALNCRNNMLTSLDISKNTKLVALSCSKNNMIDETAVNGLDKNITTAFIFEPQNTLEAANSLPTSAKTALPSASKVLVNGKTIAFDAYNIENNNYFKLRDIAQSLIGSAKQFGVNWDEKANVILLTSNKAYNVMGVEMISGSTDICEATKTTSKIHLDGKEVQLTAYNINGNNYFKLRDLGQVLDFGVSWDAAKNTISIDTSKGYTPE